MNTRTSCWKTCAAVVAICAGGCLQCCLAQDSNRLEALKQRYDFAAWVGKTKANYAHKITGWEPDFTSIGGTNVVARPWGRGGHAKLYSFNPVENPGVRLYLRVLECANVYDAHEAIMEHFSNSAAVHPYPLGTGVGVEVGDRCYLGPSKRSSIVFARNNIFLVLVVVEGDYSVVGIAKRLDSQLKDKKP